MSWVDIRNYDKLFLGFQIDSHSSERNPGLNHYLNKIIEQNEQILKELKALNSYNKGRKL